MLVRNLITISDREISSYVESSTYAVLFFTDSVSRVTDSTKYVKDGHYWYTVDGYRADDITCHLLDYSVSRWYENSEIRNYVSIIMAQPTDLDEQRQTNSFSGKNWK